MALTRLSPGVYRNAGGGVVRTPNGAIPQGQPPRKQQAVRQPGVTAQQTAANPQFQNFLETQGFRQGNNGLLINPKGKTRTLQQVANNRFGKTFARDQALATSGGGERAAPQGYQLSNPSGALSAQQGYNEWNTEEQSQQNRPNEYNPYGSQTFEMGPDGRMVQRQTLDPYEQQKLDQDRQRDTGLGSTAGDLAGRAGQSFSQGYDISGIGNDPRNLDFGGERKRIEEGIAGRFEELNAKRFNDDREQVKSRLLNSGVPVGSELYNNQMAELDRRQQDERSAAQTNALQLGGSEMQRSYDMSQDARARSIGEYQQQRNSSYDDLARILGIRGGVNNPQFQQRSDVNVAGLDIPGTGLAYKQMEEEMRNNRFNRKMAGRSGRGGGGRGGGYQPTQQPFQFMPPPPQQPQSPGFGEQLFGAVAPGLSMGLGQGLGSWVKGLF